MATREMVKYGVPLVLVIALVTAVIMLGLASQNPDGFEWTLFSFVGVPEPESGFQGIWAFLGGTTVAQVATGIIGIVILLAMGYTFFRAASRKSK